MEKLASRTVLHCCSVKSATPNTVNTEEAALGDSTDESLGGSTDEGLVELGGTATSCKTDVKNLLVSMFNGQREENWIGLSYLT